MENARQAEGAKAEAGAVLQIQIFLYLQLLDVMTTLIGMRMGLSERSPFVRLLIEAGGPGAGLALSKAVAFVLVGLCLRLNKGRLVRWINYWYAGLVVWNMGLIFMVLRTAY